jgi:squalene-hopene/tetraprenyl-beta-curcumene cyclase
VAAGVNWLLAFQQPAGGWGELPSQAAEGQSRLQGPTTATQTAWAILGLLAVGMHQHSAVARGMRYLISEHCEAGIWDEAQATCVASPEGSYVRHSLFPIYYPLLAMSRWASAVDRQSEAATSAGGLALELFEAGV